MLKQDTGQIVHRDYLQGFLTSIEKLFRFLLTFSTKKLKILEQMFGKVLTRKYSCGNIKLYE